MKSNSTITLFTGFFLSIIIIACAIPESGMESAPQSPGPDSTAPVPGSNGTIDLTQLTSTSLSISWIAAADEVTVPESLEYKVVQSSNPDIATPGEALGAANIPLDWSANTTSFVRTGLSLGAIYYFNVIVRDSSDNVNVYTMASITMINKDPPVPGNGGMIATTFPRATSQPVSWTAASDAIDTDPAELQYKLVRSLNPDIVTVKNVETDGNGIVVSDWSANRTSFIDTGLVQRTNYYYNVIVRDTDGNKAAYHMTLLSTPVSESSVFDFSPGNTLDQYRFTNITHMEPITTPEGYLLTATAGLDMNSSYISTFETPVFSDMDRTEGNGFAITWQVRYLADRLTTGYANMNQTWVKLLDRNGTVLYTVLWMPIPNEADRGRFNKVIFKGTNIDITSDYQEQLVFPTGLNSPAWVSYRLVLDSTGIRAYNDLTADATTTNGSPVWAVLSPKLSSTDTDYNHVAKIRFEYQHLGDYSIQVKDFTIEALP